MRGKFALVLVARGVWVYAFGQSSHWLNKNECNSLWCMYVCVCFGCKLTYFQCQPPIPLELMGEWTSVRFAHSPTPTLIHWILDKGMNYRSRFSRFESSSAIDYLGDLVLCLSFRKMVMVVPLSEDREGCIFRPLRTGEEIESFLTIGHAKMLIGSLLPIMLKRKNIMHFTSTQNSQPILKNNNTKAQQNVHLEK